MQELITHLAIAREQLAEAKQALSEKKAQYEAENKTLIEQVALLSTQVSEYESAVRGDAVKSFSETGEKHPHDAVTVKEYESEYTTFREIEARAWALVNAPALLVINVNAYDVLLKSGEVAGMPGEIVKSVEAKATIARDLSKYINAESES